MLVSAQEEQVQEESSSVAPEPEHEQEPEQAPQPQIAAEEAVGFIPYDDDADDFCLSPADEFASDEDSLSPPSLGSDYGYNSALYAAIHDDVGYQNQYASSNQDDVPETLDCDDPDYLSSNGTYQSESEYIDLASLTPTASQFNDMIYRPHGDKDESSYGISDTFDNSLECAQNNATVISFPKIPAIAPATPRNTTSATTDLTSGHSLVTTNPSTCLPKVANKDKENKSSYTSRLKRKHGLSSSEADISENAPKHRKLVGSMSVNNLNTTKVDKPQITSPKRAGLGCLDNQSTQRVNKSSDAARKTTPQSNAWQDLENQPVNSIQLASNVQKQPFQQRTSKTSTSKEASVITAVPQPIIQQTINNASTVAAPNYTTVSVLGKKRTRHERDEYDFYSDYHHPQAKRFFNELLSKDPF